MFGKYQFQNMFNDSPIGIKFKYMVLVDDVFKLFDWGWGKNMDLVIEIRYQRDQKRVDQSLKQIVNPEAFQFQQRCWSW